MILFSNIFLSGILDDEHGIKCRLDGNMIMGLFGRSKQNNAIIEQMRVLLDNFQFADLQTFCVNVIGENPAIDKEHLSSTEILDFIWDKYHKGKVQFSQLKEFSLKQNIVSENFFE